MKRRQYTTEFKKDAAYQIIIEGVAVQGKRPSEDLS